METKQTLVKETDLRTRYYRVRLEFSPAPDQPTTQATSADSTPRFYDMPDALVIHAHGAIGRFDPVGHCIYCATTEYAPGAKRRLGEEHIVADGLGGTLILPEASCLKCEGKTSNIERVVLRELLLASRHRLNVRPKKRKDDPTTFPVKSIVDGSEVTFNLPLDTHPTMIFMLRFAGPGFLVDRPLGQSGIAGLWMHGLNDMAKAGSPKIISPTLDTVTFCQFLAKIGHSVAVASLGEDLFVPLLLSFIQRKFAKEEQYPECYHLIGGLPGDFAPSRALHELGIALTEKNGKWYLAVHIRLFANLGTPVFAAVVGELANGVTPEQVQARLKAPKAFSRTQAR